MSNILGVSFFKGTVEEACKKAQSGGLVVAPSGPGMANDLPSCEIYAQALLTNNYKVLTVNESELKGDYFYDAVHLTPQGSYYIADFYSRNLGLK